MDSFIEQSKSEWEEELKAKSVALVNKSVVENVEDGEEEVGMDASAGTDFFKNMMSRVEPVVDGEEEVDVGTESGTNFFKTIASNSQSAVSDDDFDFYNDLLDSYGSSDTVSYSEQKEVNTEPIRGTILEDLPFRRVEPQATPVEVRQEVVDTGYISKPKEIVRGTILEDLPNERVVEDQRVSYEEEEVFEEPFEEPQRVGGTILEDLPERVIPKEKVRGTILEDLPIRIEPENTYAEEEYYEEEEDDVILEEVEDFGSGYSESYEETEDTEDWAENFFEENVPPSARVPDDWAEEFLEEDVPPSARVVDTSEEDFLFGDSDDLVPLEVEEQRVEHREEQRVEPKPQNSNIIDMSSGRKVDNPVPNAVSYPDVRSFVKANKGCTIDEALKYFSKKEVEKAIAGMKIYNKRGKLFV